MPFRFLCGTIQCVAGTEERLNVRRRPEGAGLACKSLLPWLAGVFRDMLILFPLIASGKRYDRALLAIAKTMELLISEIGIESIITLLGFADYRIRAIIALCESGEVGRLCVSFAADSRDYSESEPPKRVRINSLVLSAESFTVPGPLRTKKSPPSSFSRPFHERNTGSGLR